jgi:flavin-dependent dehydrogenase
MHDLMVIGAGPGGLTAAREAARLGLKVLLIEKKQKPAEMKRLCSQLMRLGTGGFSSDLQPTDKPIKQATVTLETDFAESKILLHNPELEVKYKGGLHLYRNERWVSPSGINFGTIPDNDHNYGYLIDKEALLAGLLDECLKLGVELRTGLKCTDIGEGTDGVDCTVIPEMGGGMPEKVIARRCVLADGAFSPIMEKLGFNAGRTGPPPLKFLLYVLDRLDMPFADTEYVKIAMPSLHKGQVSVGAWPHGTYHIQVSTAVNSPQSLPATLDKLMQDSPFSAWFKGAKVIKKMACNMALTSNIENPARGKLICVGDNAAYAETAMKGAIGCGLRAAMATRMSLAGEDGNTIFNKYWDLAFYAHSPQYRSMGRRALPSPRVLNDQETDALYQWVVDSHLHGMVNDIVGTNMERLKKEMPALHEKLKFPVAGGG